MNIGSSSPLKTGSGYGGSAQDSTIRNRGKKAAKKREDATWAAWQKDLRAFLETSKPVIATNTTTTAAATQQQQHSILDVLKKVLRSQAPNWWKQPHRRTYVLALRVSIRLTQESPKLWGDLDDTESAICALDEVARTSKLLVGSSSSSSSSPKTTTGKSHSLDSLSQQLKKATKGVQSTKETDLFLPKAFIQVQTATTHALQALATGDCFVAMNPQEHYRQTMRPLAFDLVSNPLDWPKHYYAPGGGYTASGQTQPYYHNQAVHQGKKKHNKKKNNNNNNSGKSNRATTALWKELSTYPTALPIEYGSSIFCRAHEADLDKLRVLIIGPEDTPYANGCFFFDVSIGENYPRAPPRVQFLTTTMIVCGAAHNKINSNTPVRFNPNLYESGKVCLSLLGTWSGPGWKSNESTLLQVLVSLQSLVLGSPNPYFNEPGYEGSEGTMSGNFQSKQYNLDIRKKTLRVAMLPFLYNSLLRSSKRTRDFFPEFHEVLKRHFDLKQASIRKQLRAWLQEDASLQYLYCEFWETHFEVQKSLQATKNRKTTPRGLAATAKRPMEEDGVIVLLDDDDDDDDGKPQHSSKDSAAKKESSDTNDDKNAIVYELLDNDDDGMDRKPAAKRFKTDKVVDLT